MSRQHYSGLCIGGPLAGQSIAMQGPVLTIEQAPSRVMKLKPGKPERNIISFTTERYRWIEIEGLGLWVLEGTTPMEAMNELGMGYMESVK